MSQIPSLDLNLCWTLFCICILLVILFEILDTYYIPPTPPLVENHYNILRGAILLYMEHRREARRRG